MCKKLKCKDRWDVVDPIGKKRGLMMFWRDYVQICQIIKSDFCMQVEFEGEGFDGKCLVVFIYAIEESIRRLQ